jgi:hypothetical protein
MQQNTARGTEWQQGSKCLSFFIATNRKLHLRLFKQA